MAEFRGQLSLLAAVRESGRTVLAAQSFRAPFHLSKPYWDFDARTLLVQVVNPTAGILSGDRLESRIAVQRAAALLVTTPSASRVFQMRDGAAECQQHFAVASGGWLEVMPEPLVPHRGANYRQCTTIEVEAGGALFYAEQLMPGRLAHAEAWAWRRLRLELSVRLGGELILRERFDQDGDELRQAAEFAGTGGATCFASAILIDASAAPQPLPPWQAAIAALHGEGTWVGVSALRRGGWSVKVVAPAPIRLRAVLREIRRILADHFPRLRCDARKL